MAITRTCSCGKLHPVGYKCPIVAARRAAQKKKSADKYKSNTERVLRSSYAWKTKSLEVRDQALHICEVCADKHLTFSAGQPVEAHHIISVRNDKDLLVDDYNICVLCRQHHEQAENGKIKKNYLLELARKRIEKNKLRVPCDSSSPPS